MPSRNFGLRRVALQKIKCITQRKKHGFQSRKHDEEAVVNAEQQPIIETPLSRRWTRLHSAIEAARRHHKKVQQQAIKAEPENYPEERANAGKQSVKAIVAAAQRHKKKCQQHQVGPQAFRGDEVKIVVS